MTTPAQPPRPHVQQLLIGLHGNLQLLAEYAAAGGLLERAEYTAVVAELAHQVGLHRKTVEGYVGSGEKGAAGVAEFRRMIQNFTAGSSIDEHEKLDGSRN